MSKKTKVIVVSRDELLARREVILSTLGYSLEEWNKICNNEDWRDDDWVYRDELSDIGFLLGE